METGNGKKRVGCLYRVSTKKQINIEDDIPMQRNACIEYMKKKEDWVLTKEYLEPGVSGYHKGLNERKVLQEVIRDVGDKKIDILLVFMFDRIGRRDDETPFLLKRIAECGVEVWSVCEGQQTFENSADNLMNIIRFWGANTESRKTAVRVDSGRNYATKMGKFTGGTVPYGYKLIPTGKLDRKNRMINELTRDPLESRVVQVIYEKLIDENMSLNGIITYLNEDRQIRTRRGNKWSASTVRNILKNPLYKGYMSYGKTRMREIEAFSGEEVTKEAFLDVKRRQKAVPPEEWILAKEANPAYRIVSEEQWQLAQEILARRYRRHVEGVGGSADGSWKSSLLLVGLLECGYCHGRISPAVSVQRTRRADGAMSENRTEYYKCNTRARDKRLCPARSYISRLKLEKAVLEEVYRFLDRLEQADCSEQIRDSQRLCAKEAQAEQEKLISLHREYKKTQEHAEKLKLEVYRAVIGESDFDGKYLNECLRSAEEKEEKLEREMRFLEKSMSEKQRHADEALKTAEKQPVWREVFEEAPLNVRKKLLSILIENIVVTGNTLDIYFRTEPFGAGTPGKAAEDGEEQAGTMKPKAESLQKYDTIGK